MAAAAGAAVLFALNGPVSKTVLTSGLDPQQLVTVRSVGTAAVFMLVAALMPTADLRIGRRELLWVAGYGLVGLALVNWLYFVAIGRMPVGISLLIEFTAPLWVALWGRVVLRRPLRRRVWAALGLVLGGLVLVAQVWGGLTLDPLGLGAAVTAALCLAAYYVMGERGLGRRDPFSLAAYSFGASAVVWSVACPWPRFPFAALAAPATLGLPALHAQITVPLGVLVLWVVLMGTVAPYALVLTALPRIGPTRTGLIGTLEPPLAAVVSWSVLGEGLGRWQVLGAVVVLGGILVAETARAAAPPRGRRPAPVAPADLRITLDGPTAPAAPPTAPAGAAGPAS